MVVEQRVQLTVNQNELLNTQILLHKMEDEVVNLRKATAAQETRLAVTETDMEYVKKDNAAQDTDLTSMKTEVMNLIKENAAQETRLSASETEVENLKMETAAQEAELTAVKTRLAAAETEVVNLEKEITEQPKVAFSAGLGSGYIESGNTELNLVFTKIITNVGQAYSSMTGFFTAPVRGVYYFRFTVMDHLASRYMTIRMCKNGEQVLHLQEYDSDVRETYLSSGATLQLEEGDVVNMRLPAGKRLYDDADNHSTFSGFLLFPL
ncbi:complement C1q-like protein 2 [Sardina pilchardus]|uniref:complement C1q-like protein 2 n=1 Tax=Sardina pilchardus TaxID=27697 RepID=UPI002E14B958